MVAKRRVSDGRCAEMRRGPTTEREGVLAEQLAFTSNLGWLARAADLGPWRRPPCRRDVLPHGADVRGRRVPRPRPSRLLARSLPAFHRRARRPRRQDERARREAWPPGPQDRDRPSRSRHGSRTTRVGFWTDWRMTLIDGSGVAPRTTPWSANARPIGEHSRDAGSPGLGDAMGRRRTPGPLPCWAARAPPTSSSAWTCRPRSAQPTPDEP